MTGDLQAADPQHIGAMPRARKARRLWLIAIVVVVLALAGAGTVYALHPRPVPVLRPAGLTAGARGVTSISIAWSKPASGPLPDKYVILRDGAVAGTVAGNADHFNDGGLVPATTYAFRVIAYRGGVRSQSSNTLRAATQTPSLSAAVFNSTFDVTETIKSGASVLQGETDGDVHADEWAFASGCRVGPCAASLTGFIYLSGFQAVLKRAGDGNYTATVQMNDHFYCGGVFGNPLHSTMDIMVRPGGAHVSGTQWLVTELSGSITWKVDAGTDGSGGTCPGGVLVISLAS